MLCCGVYHYSWCFYHHRLTFDPPCSASPGMSPPAAAPASMAMTSTATLAATDSRRRARVLCDYDASDTTELSLMADEVKPLYIFADFFFFFTYFFPKLASALSGLLDWLNTLFLLFVVFQWNIFFTVNIKVTHISRVRV